MVPLNRAAALLALWRLDEARALLHPLVQKPHSEQKPLMFVARPALALCTALLGDRTAAIREIALQPEAPLSLLAGAVLAIRGGEFEKARRLLERNELDELAGTQRALTEALQAWCVARLTGEHRPISVVRLLGEAGPDALRRAWPEFVDWLELERAA